MQNAIWTRHLVCWLFSIVSQGKVLQGWLTVYYITDSNDKLYQEQLNILAEMLNQLLLLYSLCVTNGVIICLPQKRTWCFGDSSQVVRKIAQLRGWRRAVESGNSTLLSLSTCVDWENKAARHTEGVWTAGGYRLSGTGAGQAHHRAAPVLGDIQPRLGEQRRGGTSCSLVHFIRLISAVPFLSTRASPECKTWYPLLNWESLRMAKCTTKAPS